MNARLLASAATALAVLYGIVGACTDPPLHEYCTEIPTGGCPGGTGGAANCVDPTCEAIYTCDYTNNTWSFVTKCPNYKPPHDAGRDGTGGDGAADGPPEDARPRDAGFVLPEGANGGPGCIELESPDCPVAEALSCSDCCGCQDLYACADGGWDLWGECDDAGRVLPLDGGL
jgi:hypothetical protein